MLEFQQQLALLVNSSQSSSSRISALEHERDAYQIQVDEAQIALQITSDELTALRERHVALQREADLATSRSDAAAASMHDLRLQHDRLGHVSRAALDAVLRLKTHLTEVQSLTARNAAQMHTQCSNMAADISHRIQLKLNEAASAYQRQLSALNKSHHDATLALSSRIDALQLDLSRASSLRESAESRASTSQIQAETLQRQLSSSTTRIATLEESATQA